MPWEDEDALIHNSSTSNFSACYPPPPEYKSFRNTRWFKSNHQKRYINWEWPLRKIWGDRGKNCFKMPTASEIHSSLTSVEMFSFLQSEALTRSKETYVPLDSKNPSSHLTTLLLEAVWKITKKRL